MFALPKIGRACAGACVLLALYGAPAPAQTTAEDARSDVAQGAADEVQSLNSQDLAPLDGAGELGAAPEMTEFADFGVEWPDMSEVGDTTVGEARDAVAANTEQHYSVQLTGLDDVDGDVAEAIRTQFDTLSILRENDGDRAVVAQIDRRADTDTDLLREIMRSHGFYDARVSGSLQSEPGGNAIDVTLAVVPGQLYTFDRVDLPGLADAGARTDELREQYAVETGDAVDAGEVVTARANLIKELGNRGYPFAEVAEEQVTVDHAGRVATITQPVEPGGERDFGRISVSEGAEEVFGADHVETIARFDNGDLYSNEMLDDLRRALIQTGLVSRVELTPVDPGDNETVDISVAMQAAPPRTVSGEIGYGTGEGARVELNWEHRNLLGPEGAVGVRGIAGTDEQYFGLSYRRSNFLARDQILSTQLYAGNIDRAAYAARTIGITAGLERVSTQLWQKPWDLVGRHRDPAVRRARRRLPRADPRAPDVRDRRDPRSARL